MDIDFLQKLLSLLVKLQRAVTNKNAREKKNLRQQIQKHIEPFKQFVDTLRQCQSMYGCHNNQTFEVITWTADALHQYGRPYPALWYYGFAHEKFLIELMRWIREATLIEDIKRGKQTGIKTARKLTDRQLLAFKLVVGRRLNHRQAAELMGISRPAVTRLMGRILGKEHKGTRHKNTSLTP